MADKKNWLQVLAYVTGSINQELLLRNEYLAADNHILNLRSKGDCGCPMARGRTWPGLPSVWGGKPYRKSPASANRIRSSASIGSSSLRNSTARRNADWPAGRESMRQSKSWW